MPPLMLARRELAATVVVDAVLIVFFITIRDSTEEVFVASGRPRLGSALHFEATAYCKGATTAAGVAVRTGMAAADPALLPLGSVVQVQTPVARHNGIWTVLDTGPEVKGRELDLYMWSCNDALAFGRQTAQVTILRLGWDPQNSAPAGVEELFRRRERARPVSPAPATPPEPAPSVAPTPAPPPSTPPSS